MRVEKLDGSKGRRILTGMLVDSTVLGRIAPKWTKEGLFRSTWENLVAGWAVDYYNRYGKAPKRQIEGLYESWAQTSRDKDTTKLVSTFLRELSGEYVRLGKESNSDYIIDLAGEHFNRIAVSKLRDALSGDLDTGKVNKSLKRIHNFGDVEVGKGESYVDFLSDDEAIKEVFSHKAESLVQYDGALGKFFGDELCRDAFIAFQGIAKRGKTWWLIDLAWRAMLQRRRVAFFEIGDLSRRQILNRLCVRAARRPRKARSILIPKTLRVDSDGALSVTHREKEFKKPMTFKTAVKARRRIAEEVLKSDRSYLRISTHPARTLSVAGMRSIFRDWERQDKWVPDVVVLDYADLLKRPAGYETDPRESVNDNWMGLRQTSQELHCLMVTATQAKATAYKVKTQGMEHFSEDNRKNAHVTGMVAIDQDDTERNEGVMRLSFTNLREDENPTSRSVYVAGCLGIANPAILSAFAGQE